MLGINFAALQDKIPIIYGRRFTISRNDPIVMVEKHHCPGKDCPVGKDIFLVGPHRLKEKFSKEHADLSGSLVDLAQAFIQDQIDENIPDVGAPIDLVRLTSSDGLEWIQRKPGC